MCTGVVISKVEAKEKGVKVEMKEYKA